MTYVRILPAIKRQYISFYTSGFFIFKMSVNSGSEVVVDWGDDFNIIWEADGTEKTVIHNYVLPGEYAVRLEGDFLGVTGISLANQTSCYGCFNIFNIFENLSSLDLQDKGFYGALYHIEHLVNLVYLNISNTQITS